MEHHIDRYEEGGEGYAPERRTLVRVSDHGYIVVELWEGGKRLSVDILNERKLAWLRQTLT